MFKIGDFSKLNKVSIKALRHYDELGLLKPVKVDDSTGYRYYSAAQLPKLNKILALKDLGFSLNKITEIIDYDQTSEFLSSMLAIRKEELMESIKKDKEKLSRIENLINTINEEVNYNMLKYDVIIKEVESLKIASIREIISYYDKQGPLWEELVEYLNQNNVKMLQPCILNYHDSGYKESDVDVEVAIHVASTVPSNGRVIFRDLEGYKEMVCAIHKGSYESIGTTYHVIMKWIEENGYKIIGNNRALFLEGGWSVKNPEEYITEIQIPVTKE